MKLNFFRKSLCYATLPLLLLACSNEEHSDLKSWMQQAQQGLKGKVTPLPQLKNFPVIDFDATQVSDPFLVTRLEPEKRASVNTPDKNRRREPLEAYPLEALKFVGMMVKDKKARDNSPVALVQADKVLYQVRVGNYIGQNFGQIVKVSETELSLKELVEDSTGDWIERMSTIQLQEQETKR